MSVMQTLNAVFIDVFDDPDIRLYPEMTANDVDGWDSLSHINLIVAVETKFGIRFAQKEIRSFKNVGELLRCIENKL